MSKINELLYAKYTPTFQEEPEDHLCDSCASSMIYELTHQFENVNGEEMIELCVERIFQAIENRDNEEIIDATVDLFESAFDAGVKDNLKDEIHRLSGILAMMTSEVVGDEQ